MEIQINNTNTTFKSRYEPLNALNPISYYANRYFSKSAKISSRNIEEISSDLCGKIKYTEIKHKQKILAAWDINPNHSKEYVFFLHGMAQNVTNYQKLYKKILDKNKGVFALEYRGYGMSSPGAKISEKRFKHDIEAAFQHLVNKNKINPKNITIIGHSMGGSLAAHLASKHPDVKSLILICPISDMEHIGQKFSINKNIGQGIPKKLKEITDKIGPLRWLYNLKFNTIKHMENINVPTYIIQSKNDTVTISSGAEKLAKTAKKRGILKDYIVTPLGGHKVDSKKIDIVSDILDKL